MTCCRPNLKLILTSQGSLNSEFCRASKNLDLILKSQIAISNVRIHNSVMQQQQYTHICTRPRQVRRMQRALCIKGTGKQHRLTATTTIRSKQSPRVFSANKHRVQKAKIVHITPDMERPPTRVIIHLCSHGTPTALPFLALVHPPFVVLDPTCPDKNLLAIAKAYVY